MRWTSFNDLLLWPDSPEVPGVVTDLGSTFRNPSAAVAMGEHRLNLRRGHRLRLVPQVIQLPARSWSAERECLGGDLTSTPVVVSTAAERLDIFVLGPDQGLLHRRRTGSAWSAWKELGGCFTSAPAVLPTGLDTFDIFAHRPDYLIYQSRLTAVGFSGWETLGSGLLREPIAASAPAVARVQDEVYCLPWWRRTWPHGLPGSTGILMETLVSLVASSSQILWRSRYSRRSTGHRPEPPGSLGSVQATTSCCITGSRRAWSTGACTAGSLVPTAQQPHRRDATGAGRAPGP